MKRSIEETIEEIEKFFAGTGGAHDWDDFTSIRLRNPDMEAVRIECDYLPEKYPPAEGEGYCNEQGLRRLREIVADLRARQKQLIPGS